jgi:hypothetical protein
MSKEIIFTRYLYEKEEVETALMLSLLHKREEEALFWAYELYYSGFQTQLTNLLWKIYYDFYASLNIGFQTYLLKKIKNPTFMQEPKILGSIIQNFIIRPFNVDVFMLQHIQNQFEIPKKEKINNLTLLKEVPLDYESLLHVITDMIDSNKIITLLDDKLKKEWKKIEKVKLPVDKKVLLLAYLLQQYGLNQKKQMGKNIYVCSDQEDFIMYKTMEVDLTPQENRKIAKLPAYKILPLVTLYSINESTFLSLFEFQRELKTTKREAYLKNWLYHASQSPIWMERIHRYKGEIQNNKIVFEDEDKEEEFYQNYGYEPDEQKKEVQERSIKENSKNSATSIQTFYQTFSQKRFFDLEEEYLSNLSTVFHFS